MSSDDSDSRDRKRRQKFTTERLTEQSHNERNRQESHGRHRPPAERYRRRSRERSESGYRSREDRRERERREKKSTASKLDADEIARKKKESVKIIQDEIQKKIAECKAQKISDPVYVKKLEIKSSGENTSKKKSNVNQENNLSDSSYGPALPPHMSRTFSGPDDPKAKKVPSVSPTKPQPSCSGTSPEVYEKPPRSVSSGRPVDVSSSAVPNISGTTLHSDLEKAENYGSHSSGTTHNTNLVVPSLVDRPGPTVPPHVLNKVDTSPDVPPVDQIIGPALPPHLLNKVTIGPCLPPPVTNQPGDDSCVKECGPSQPTTVPGCSPVQESHKIIGPAVPDFLRHISNSGDVTDEESKSSTSDSEEEIIGPDVRLMTQGLSEDGAPLDVERRAEKMRRKLAGEVDSNLQLQRETWMLELPPERATDLGLGPRQFKRKLGPAKDGDRSSWTDTPLDTAKKAAEPPPLNDLERVKQHAISERDKEMEELLEKSKKKKKKSEMSLVEMHQRKLKKQAKKEAKKRDKEGKPVERRPFDRDIDLQVNRFDEAQKRAVLKKAQLLNDRFSRGESKFL